MSQHDETTYPKSKHEINDVYLPQIVNISKSFFRLVVCVAIAQLGERKTEDLEAPCSIHGCDRLHFYLLLQYRSLERGLIVV